MPLIQRQGKTSSKKAIELAKGSNVLRNYAHGRNLVLSVAVENFYGSLTDRLFGEPYWWAGWEVLSFLGPPLVRIYDYESSPGVWIFDDTESKIRIVIFSDGWKKNPYKGTSIEVVIPEGRESALNDVLISLKKILRGEA